MKIFLSLFLVFTSCGVFPNRNLSNDSSKYSSIQISNDTVITKQYFETGGLYNRNYEIKILGTGEVKFKGKFAGNEFYKEEWIVPKEDIARLIEKFKDSGFFQLANSYGKIATDMAEMTISVKIDEEEKSVKRLSFNNTPEEKKLENLDHLINETVNAIPRIRKCCYYFPDYPAESIP